MDFSYKNTTLQSSGGFKPLPTNTPLDVRTVVDTYADIATIPNPFVGMNITVKVDETNGNVMTDYKVKSLKSNALGMPNTTVDKIEKMIEYLGVPTKLSELENDSEYVTVTDLNYINSQINNISSLTYAYDVNDTIFKKDQKVDINKLKMNQIKNISNLYHNLREKNVPVKFCHRGDSLTFGYDSTSSRVTSYTWANGETYTNNQANKTYPEAMEDVLKTIYGDDMILPHINRGKGGDYAKGSLIRHNGKHDADCTLLMLGTNDSRNDNCPYVGNVKSYLYWVEQIIIQELSWDKCVVLLSPPITKIQNDYNVDSFANGLKYLSQKWDIPFIDTQELLIGYTEDIWSDRTHLSSLGYTILGTKISACFVGEGLLNPNEVSSGDSFEASLMTSSTYYTDGDVTYSHSLNTDTPPHNTFLDNVQGFLYKILNSNGKIFISLYCKNDNLCFIPSAFVRGGYSMSVLLDNGIKPSENILDSSIFNQQTYSDENLSLIEYNADESIRIDKMYFRNNLIYPLRLITKGWHLIQISGDSKQGGDLGPCNVMGYEIISFNDIYNIISNYRVKPQQLYIAINENGGLVRPSIGDNIKLTKNISIFDTLYVTTGGVESGDYTTYIVRGFNGLSFRPSVDYINVLTKGLTWITLKIIDENTLEYISIDNQYPIRDIFGILK